MKHERFCGLAATAFVTAASPATVTGLSVEFDRTIAGRDVYSVYVHSNSQSDALLVVFAHTVIAGSMANVLHTDSFLNDYDEAVGNWNPSYTSASTAPTSNQWRDSYVTVTGKVGAQGSTSLDPRLRLWMPG